MIRRLVIAAMLMLVAVPAVQAQVATPATGAPTERW